MEQIGNNEKVPAAGSRRRTRACLACGAGFRPASRFIRICPSCKESEEWQSGNCDFVLQPAANDNDPAC